MRFDRCLVPNSICGPSRASVLTGKYSHLQRLLQQHQQPVRRLADRRSPSCSRPPATRRPSIGKWHLVTDPTGFDDWHILPGQGVYYNPPMIHNGQRVQARGLHHRPHHRLQPRLAQEPRQVEAVPADVPAQGPAPRVGAGPPAPGHDGDRKYPEPRDPVRRLLRPRQGRARPGHDDRQDDDRRWTSSSRRPPSLDARAAQGLGRLLRAAQRRVPRGRTSRARTSSAGSINGTCTTTSAASRPSTRASAGC